MRSTRTSFGRRLFIAVSAGLFLVPTLAETQAISASGIHPNRRGEIDTPLRYRPQNGAFVIENGQERFNRPLYGGNTGFRVDGGDLPEFVLYLPGRGGNLRFAVRTGASDAWWLHEAQTIVTGYLPGELEYEIRDPRLNGGRLRLVVLAYDEVEGVIVRAQGEGLPADATLLWAFGGVNGQRGRRDGDIGTEAVPISQWFQLQPDFALGNRIAADPQSFTLTAAPATLYGTIAGGQVHGVAEAGDWERPERLFASPAGATSRPVVVGALLLRAEPVFLSIQLLGDSAVAPGGAPAPLARSSAPPFTASALPARFERTRAQFDQLRRRVVVDTPDPYLDAAVGALNLAADAVWDEPQQAIMHGAVAWRTKLLGWRGLYALNALGWHERADANFRTWFPRQNVSPVPPTLPPPDEESNLARMEAALHSNGDLSNSHYDMNAVFVDGLFRHLAWTADLSLAREAWPVLVRHLAWQRRLFRRSFGPEGLPLYEAYAQIWASDDIHYGGGGVAYASAYNASANRQAARLARQLGEDPGPYEREAELIEQAMRRYLWQLEQGTFAEYKDLLGEQLVHPSAGLWSFYLVLDSEVPTPREAWSMAGAVLRNLPRLPVEGARVPTDRAYALFSTTDWMPYSWSVNNVVMGENAHTALGLWQAGRQEAAFTLTKSAILASMFMGITPGNVGTLNYLDVYRRESQRDFADGSGVLSRAIVEGLFGLVPDALDRVLRVRPGFPTGWEHAAITHPDVGLAYRREGTVERYVVTQSGGRFDRIVLRLPARRATLVSATANGQPLPWQSDPDAVGRPYVLLETPGETRTEVVLDWSGAELAASENDGVLQMQRQGDFSWLAPTGSPPAPLAGYALPPQQAPSGPQETVDLGPFFNDRLTNLFAPGKYRSPRSPGASLSLPAQGIGAWAGHVNEMAEIDDRGLRDAASVDGLFRLPDGGVFRLSAAAGAPNAAFVSQWSNYPKTIAIPLSGRARYLRLLMAGSTNPMQSRIDNGEVVVTYTDGTMARLPLHNPASWWPIEKDYLIDEYQFRVAGDRPLRVDLRTGRVRRPDGLSGEMIPGGAATVLGLPLDPTRSLRSVTVRALAQDVVIGTLGMTLIR